jgi:cytochrome c2
MAKVEPGRDPEMVHRTNSLNILFALTSIGLLLAFSWMVWADYAREWKKYQVQFAKMEKDKTRQAIADAGNKVDKARIEQIDARLAQGRQEEAQRQADISKVQSEIKDLEGEEYRVDQNFRFTKADIDVARYNYEEAAEHKARSSDQRKKHLDGLVHRWEDLRKQLEDVKARKADLQAKLGELEKTRLTAEGEKKELLAEQTRLNDRLDKMGGAFVTFTRNMPVLDMFNPSLRVGQIMPANINDDVIFSPTPKVDRCTTCHLGIDKKGYEDAPQPYRTHPNMELYLRGPHPIDRVGCTVCHQGRGRATGFVNAAHTASTVDQEKAWGRYQGHEKYETMHYWDLPMMSKGNTEAQCRKCHQGAVDVPQAAQLNTGLMMIERYGCFGCHKIKGWEGLRKVGPDLRKVTSKTDEEWIYRWIKEPKAFRPTRMPQVWDVRVDETDQTRKRNDVEANAVAAYITANSDPPVAYPAPPGGDAAAGQKTFESIGCLGCHRVGEDRRGIDTFAAASFRAHGPNLSGTGSKVNAGWLYSWIHDPKGYWHETRMPNLRLTDAEAANITAYLMTLKNDAFRGRPRPGMDAAIRDEAIREHLLAASVPVKQVEQQLSSMDDRQKTLFLGEKTIGRYGCFGCHEIKGFEKANPIGVELTEEGSKLVERLDFAYEHGKIPHTLPGWLHRKVMEPRVFDVGKVKRPEEMLRMPKFWLNDDEARAIVTGVMSLSKEQVPLAAQKQLSPDERHAEEAMRLIREYNCRGCHVVGAGGGSMRAVIEDQLEQGGGDVLQAQALSAPILYNAESKIGEGSRVQSDWLHGFLSDPSNKVRPWLTVRMPTFEFTEEQLNTLTRGFASLDKVPYPYATWPGQDAQLLSAGHDLFGRWQCIKCHVVAGKLPDQEPANMAPDLAKVPTRLRPDWLTQWLADPGRIAPGTRMPAAFPVKPEENAFPDVLAGDQKSQIEAMRQYLLTLGPRPARAGVPAAVPASAPTAPGASKAKRASN